MCLLLFCTLLLAGLGPLSPYLTRLTIDEHLAKKDWPMVVQMIGWLACLLMAQGVVQFFHVYLAEKVGQSVIKDVRLALYKHIQHLPVRFFDNTPVGQLITRCISDVEALCTVFNTGVASILADSLQIIFIIVLMFSIEWTLALVVCLLFPLLIVTSYVFKEKTKTAFQRVREAVAKLNVFVQEHITGMNIVQIFTAEEKEEKKFRAINKSHRKANLQAVYYYSVYFPVIELIQSLSIGLLVWFGGQDILQNNIMPGVLIAFIMYIQMIYRPFRMIADKFSTMQMGLVGAQKIFSLLYHTQPQTSPVAPNHNYPIVGDIEFHNVYFSYKEREPVLQDINLLVPEKKTLAIVGKTGAGKSSLVQLLNRFYHPQKGTITIGGKDLQTYPLHVLRKHIGTMMQDTFLFSDSIRNNVLLHSKDAHTQAQVEQLMELAKEMGISQWIEQLPKQWDFNVLEQGGLLSTGQRQLLAIFRTLAHNPSVVVMDEATASIDSNTEKIIQKALRVLIHDRTAIIVAHRLSTIMHAHKIVVMDKGQIKEIGTHKELLAKKSYYKALYETQFHYATADGQVE